VRASFRRARSSRCARTSTGLPSSRDFARRGRRPPRSSISADVHGQALARRALEVAAAGGHSLLLTGPPGTGKTMLAMRIAGILPPMEQQEALEAAAVQSLATGTFRPERFGVRPFARRTTPPRLSRSWAAARRRARRDLARAPRRAVPRRAAGIQPPRARVLREPLESAASRSRARARQAISPPASSWSPR
jgi:magnesium chelatase family protein